MKFNKKATIASFELAIMIISVFAFSYFVHSSEEDFKKIEDARTAESRQSPRTPESVYPNAVNPKKTEMFEFVGIIFKMLKRPLIPLASAEQMDLGAGCCAVAVDGQKCATTTRDNCQEDAPFAEGALCTSTSFCQKGCCYDENAGIYDKNVLKADCTSKWVKDPNCNLPGAELGCCVLGETSAFETKGQCETDTLSKALGPDAIVDWRRGINEVECLTLSATQEEGACVLAGNNCKFGTEVECLSAGGQFNKGYLCTSPSLNTSCKMTEQTACREGKDGVYFLDSCGNYANIYDSKRKDDPAYWDRIVKPEESCGNGDASNGNANSKDCGNCNRFLGGICSSAAADNFKVDVGNFYCKDTSCMYKGEKYKNGESWCVYDGAIGNGDDVVGSRHWKYVCAQGVTQIEPCADYRNQICIQTNTLNINGSEVEFKNAACVANNWRECISLNTEEDGMKKCASSLNCRVEKVHIDKYFKFDVCTPKYPGGFKFGDGRYQKTAEGICGLASQTCTVVRGPDDDGDCETKANRDCRSGEFARKMNDFCRKLGDCGGEVNIIGKYSGSYRVRHSSKLSQGYIDMLKKLAEPVPGQFAEVENYSDYLEAAGFQSVINGAPNEESDIINKTRQIGLWTGGIGYAAGVSVLALHEGGRWGSFALKGLSSSSSAFAGFAGAMMGAGIGMIVGSMLAKYLNLSPNGAALMSIGGALVGAASYLLLNNILSTAFAGTLLGIGIILIIISLFRKNDDCDNIEVRFECKPWKPPAGGDDCEKCNGDPLKPCSEYRCSSLGAACEIVNKGTDQEMCVSSKDDGKPPIIEPQIGTISGGEVYDNITGGGFRLTSAGGGCIDAYTPITFGVVTNELAYCKFDLEMTEFENMNFDLGGNAYLYNHTTTFVLPDPSHGQSQGANWTGDLTFYIKCVDVYGHESPGFYKVDVCVKEGPDKTPPVIRAISPKNDAIVGFNVSEENIKLVTNELATCRWDFSDKDYSLMSNEMTCNDTLNSPSSTQGYSCSGGFPTADKDNVYYIRCADQPWLEETGQGGERNANSQSFVYKLRKPEKKIEIDWIEPSQDFESATEMTTIELKVQTSGGGEKHFCSYSFSGFKNMIEMFETGTEKIHIQPLNLPAGENKIYVRCQDETGDSVQGETIFRITHDTSVPQIARIWQTGGTLHITTTEDAECAYNLKSCSYNWDKAESAGDGKEHTISVIKGKTYYIRCKDAFGNSPAGCSVEVQAG